ncbi:hypothetical protein J7M07_06180, partial [bacterium]|nr:hypothetical protein [bacterium]
GNVFNNGSVVVNNPASIDSNSVDSCLPSGESANYSGGQLFPYETISPIPDQPILNTSFYDSLITKAASAAHADITWGTMQLTDTIYINGNLVIKKNNNITTSGTTSLVAVNGSVAVGQGVSISNGITIIARLGINISSPNVAIGVTTGRSGNLLFSRDGVIDIGQNALVNGVVLANFRCVVRKKSKVCGLVFAGNRVTVNEQSEISGVLWTNEILNGNIGKQAKIFEYQQYLPQELPRGVSCNWNTSPVKFTDNGFREIN